MISLINKIKTANPFNYIQIQKILKKTHLVSRDNEMLNIIYINELNTKYRDFMLDIEDIDNIKLICGNMDIVNKFPLIDGIYIRIYYYGNEYKYITNNHIPDSSNVNKYAKLLDTKIESFVHNIIKTQPDIWFTHIYLLQCKNINILTNIRHNRIIPLGIVNNNINNYKFRVYKSYTELCSRDIIISCINLDGKVYDSKEGVIRKRIIGNREDIFNIAILNSNNKQTIKEFNMYFPYWSKIMDIVLAKKRVLYFKLLNNIDNPSIMIVLLNIIKHKYGTKKIQLHDIELLFNNNYYSDLIYFTLFYTPPDKRVI